MSDIPITKELFDSLKKRGYGESKNQLVDPRLGIFDALRQTSFWTGEIFQPQLDTLKRTAMLILGGAVSIVIDQDNLIIKFKGPPITAALNNKYAQIVATRTTQLEALVLNVLGKGWKVFNESDTPSEGGKPTKPKRTRRPKKGKRKSK
jgi:hypothetical protein